ncbi:MAG TPA: N-6 DNA methylase [Cyclobacteriaceae bacterium]|jgi:type I restriction-modification system DNA methylase subunit|nr:N-6 DNA methylase [Cyclobacteriaceae bacterium]
MLDRELQDKVVSYLQLQGFSWADLKQGWDSLSRESEADILIMQQSQPFAVIEIKGKLDLNSLPKPEWSYHSAVRQAQQIALSFKAPFFAVTDTNDFFWFTHSTNGRPELLPQPVKPIELNANKKARNKEFCKNVLESFKTFTTLFYNEETLSEILYAQLLYVQGKPDLKRKWLSGKPATKKDHTQQVEKEIRDIFQRLDHTEFFSGEPEVISDAIDEVFSSGKSGLGLPKWLADLLWQAGTHDNPSKILAGLIDFPQLQSALNSGALKSARPYSVQYFYRHRNNVFWYKLKQALYNLPEENLFELSVDIGLKDNNKYDTIILAPVFGLKVDNIHNSRFSLGRDLDFSVYLIEHAVQNIAASGKILSVVPESILFSDIYKSFRQYLVKHGFVQCVVSLPIGTFYPYSGVKSSLLVLSKRQNERNILMVEPRYSLNKNSDTKKIADDLTKIISFDSESSKKKLVEHKAFLVHDDELREYRLNVSAYSLVVDERQTSSEYPLIPLVDITHKIFRGTQIKLSSEGTVAVIGPRAIRTISFRSELVDYTDSQKIAANARYVEENDIVVNAIGTHRAESATVPKEFNGTPVSQHLIVVRPNDKYVVPEYLTLLLNSSKIKSYLLSSTGTTVIASISLTALRDLQLPIPPLSIQQKVLQEFTNLDSKRRQAEQRLQTLDKEYTEFIDRISDSPLSLD